MKFDHLVKVVFYEGSPLQWHHFPICNKKVLWWGDTWKLPVFISIILTRFSLHGDSPELIIICWLPIVLTSSFLPCLFVGILLSGRALPSHLFIFLFLCDFISMDWDICILFSGCNPWLSLLSCSHRPHCFYFKDDFFEALSRNGMLTCTWFLIAWEKSHLIPYFPFLGTVINPPPVAGTVSYNSNSSSLEQPNGGSTSPSGKGSSGLEANPGNHLGDITEGCELP